MVNCQLIPMETKRKELEDELHNLGPILRGSVVELSRPCTYPRCRKCQEGTRHPSIYHSITKNSKTRLTYIPKAVQDEAIQWNQNYKESLRIVDELTKVNLDILKSKAKYHREYKAKKSLEAGQ